MALTLTDIANQALNRIGEKAIMSIDDLTLVTARKAKLVMEQTIREVTAAHIWNGLKHRATLVRRVTAPAFGWDYAYALPTDYVRLAKLNGVAVTNDDPGDYFEIEGNSLLTDEDEAKVQYVRFSLDPALYSALFTKALVTLWAAKLALTVRQDEPLAASLMQTYETVDLPRARMKDSGEGKRRRYDMASESRFVSSRRFSTNG